MRHRRHPQETANKSPCRMKGKRQRWTRSASYARDSALFALLRRTLRLPAYVFSVCSLVNPTGALRSPKRSLRCFAFEMLNLNLQKLDEVALAAFGEATEKGGRDARRWQTAIAKAKRQLEENPYIHDEGDALLILSPESLEIYHSNGTCQCKAYQSAKFPCWHRAAHRLVRREQEFSH